MAAIVVLLILVPVLAGFVGYAWFGVMGGVLCGVGAFVAMGLLVGLPFMLLVQAERRKAAADRLEWTRWSQAHDEGRPGREDRP